jgi:hypothetical protein
MHESLKPAARADAKQVAQWLAELASNEFAARQKAAEQLERLGDLAVPALEEALAGQPGPEMRKRVERLLEIANTTPPIAEKLAALRAVEILEHAGTGAALQLLEKLTKGAEEARLTREAQASLLRLQQRRDRAKE